MELLLAEVHWAQSEDGTAQTSAKRGLDCVFLSPTLA